MNLINDDIKIVVAVLEERFNEVVRRLDIANDNFSEINRQLASLNSFKDNFAGKQTIITVVVAALISVVLKVLF